MTIQIVRSLSTDQWRTFVEQHPKGNIFHTPEMFEVYRLAKNHTPELWAATEGGRILVLVIPVLITLTGGLLKRLTARSIVFGGILCEDSPNGQLALKELLKQYKRHADKSCLFAEVRNISSPAELNPILLEAGFQYQDHLNYLIKLENRAESVFNRIGPRTRKHIRQSLKRQEVQIVEVTDRLQIALCYELLRRAYRNARVPLADISFFYAAFDCLVPQKMARFTLAFVKNEPAAASIDLLYKDVIYGWYGGINRKFPAQVPNETLMWNILEWGCQNNYHVYDFGGAGKPNEKYGVRDFKAKFGGELVCFGRNTWIAHPALMAVSKFAYTMIRRVIY
ncbi:MAG: GNAT family N-acetyltransferase [Anaerolineaceae bacterium]|nr:MAG: GNAT family N-acetyltransferase [Anaerolineaceae bacterium]